MKRLLFFAIIFSTILIARDATVSLVGMNIQNHMLKGHSWHKGCPVPLQDLRYLRIPYIGFDYEPHVGEMVVHKEVADEVVDIFHALYTSGYPIHKMKLVSHYKANDWQSIEADNTSAFNCRNATGSKKWSKHSYGKAIDINPIENPYVFRSRKSSHKSSMNYIKRKPNHPAVALKRSKIVQIFKRRGWKWGGEWKGAKDYQHFYK